MGSNGGKKQRLVFICSDMKTPRKMSVVSLMNDLAETGESVTVITDARCNITDFRYEYRINRLSFDMGIEGCFTRDEKLTYFLSGNSCSTVIHTDTAREEFLQDIEVIKKSGCRLICLETDGYLKSSLDSPHSASHYYSALLRADAVVSAYAADFLVNLNSGITKTVYIPFRFPFFAGEFSPCRCEKSRILLVVNYPEAVPEKALRTLSKLMAENPLVSVRIISGDEEKTFGREAVEKCSALLPGAEFADEVETINDAAYDCAFAVIADRFIYPSYSYIMLTARLVPVVFSAEYDDSAFDYTDPEELFENCSALLNPEARKHAAESLSALLSPDGTESLISKWRLLFSSVAEEAELPQFSPPTVDDRHAAAVLRLNEDIASVIKPAAEKPKAHTAFVENIIKKISYRELKRYQQYSCVQLSPEDVRRSQLLALKMFKELERICKKHGLRYYLAAGSLLGAARHGGQIPWDDDVDVTMPRHDYERFIKIAQQELPDDMIMPVDNYPYGFHRIQIKGTSIKRALRQKGPHGIFLDVLPLDGAAPTEALKKKHARINERMIFIMYESVKPQPVLNKKNFRVWVKRLLLKKLVCKKLLHYIWYKNATRYDVEKSREWVCLPGYYGYDKECFDKSWWGEPYMMMYEGRPCPVMSKWEKYLRLHYGDYMQPPPLLFRRTHFFYGVDFGKYKNMTIEEIEKDVYKKK